MSGHVSLPIPSTRYGCSSLVVAGGVDRALRVDADDQRRRAALLEVAADAADRAARADRDHDRVDLAARLLPDLRPGRLVVGVRVRPVRVLVGLEPAGDLLGEPRRDRVVGLGRVVVDRGRRDHDLGAVAAEHRDLLLAHLVGHHEDAPVALDRGGDREADARVPGGRLDDRAAGTQPPVALGGLDHREPDAVLHGAARVEVLELGEDRPGHVARDPVEPDDRRRPDQVEDARILARHPREGYLAVYASAGTASAAGASSSRLISVTDATMHASAIPNMTQNAHCAPLVNAWANGDALRGQVVEVADRDRRDHRDADRAAHLLCGVEEARREARLVSSGRRRAPRSRSG